MEEVKSDNQNQAVVPNSGESKLHKYHHRRRLVKRSIIVVSLLAIVGTILIIVGGVAAFNRISEPTKRSSPFLKFFGDVVDPNELKGEGDGRINVILMGIGGQGHKGSQLTDTIMVASVDPINKKLALLSLPRDLRVPMPGGGQGKINSVHALAEQASAGTGPQDLKDTAEKILDLPIHYFVRVDFTGFIKIIDTLGGIQVNVPEVIDDPFYPDVNLEGYDPFHIDAGYQTLNGETALKYARSRKTTSDFDRAKRQQIIILAVKDKVLSLGVLGNPKKITNIINILGQHLKMDLSLAELEKLFKIVKDMGSDDIVSKVIDNAADGPLMTVNEGGYYLVPKTGNFRELQRIAHEIFTDPYLGQEAAKVKITNSSGNAKMGNEIRLDLVSRGYNVVEIEQATAQAQTVIYNFSGADFPVSLKLLSNRFDVGIKNRARETTEVDIEVIVGSDFVLE